MDHLEAVQVEEAKKDETGTGQNTGNSISVRAEEAKATCLRTGLHLTTLSVFLRAGCSSPPQTVSQGQAYKARI